MSLVKAFVGASLAAASWAAGTCNQHTLDFILLAGDSLSAQIEDDIKQDLEQVGINVNTRLLAKADFNAAMQQGNFHLCFTESWGPPYDPHSFATGWFRPNNEAHYPALDGLEAPLTKVRLQQMVTDVLREESPLSRQTQWTAILQEMHQQAISCPMWSRRMPAIVNRRLSGYLHGPQQFDYPVHKINVLSGDTTVTSSPGAQTGLLTSTGPMDPHSYRPNEFFISNWIYEGLVSYSGGDSAVEPQLVTSWTVTDNNGGQGYRFLLRTGVKFHDGTVFNCAGVKMTFDHVLQPPLNTLNYHGWYHLALYTQSWWCEDEVFVAFISDVYYPFLQELSLIRPLRILSRECYIDGPDSSPVSSNSCPPRWDRPLNTDGSTSDVRCRSVTCFAGTGPWKFGTKNENPDGSVSEMTFLKNDDWWGNGNRGDITQLTVKSYTSAELVQSALLSGQLDMVVGGGVLTPTQVREFDQQHASTFHVSYGPPLMNTMVVINAARSPTDNLDLRKAIIRAIDKPSILEAELAGSAQVATSVFPTDAPYCNVQLSPPWEYDLTRAQELNCPTPAPPPPENRVSAAHRSSFGASVLLGLALALHLT